MAVILVGTHSGCRAFVTSGELETELAGRRIGALTPEAGGTCLAIVDEHEVWRRDTGGLWSRVASTGLPLQSVASVKGTLFAGGMDEAVLFRIPADGAVERLNGFDNTAGREEWFAGGPPLGVRSIAATADGAAILAAVHVGGIPRSVDGGETWTPTMPVMFDVHEVRAHPLLANVVAAATAVGLCLSRDGGETWKVFSEGLNITNSLAVAVLEDAVLFSIQDGPFAKRSQVWRLSLGSDRLEQVRDGLPEWLDGKVDTGWIAAADGQGAVVDGGGNLWLSDSGSRGWERVSTGLGYVFGLAMV